MGDESLTEPTKRATGIDRWFVVFLLFASILLFIEAILMFVICGSLLMCAWYFILSCAACLIAEHYAKEG